MPTASPNSLTQQVGVATDALPRDAHRARDDVASYTSTLVQLPPTVPELIRCFEEKHERCAQLTRCLERVHTEARRLVAASTGASPEDRYHLLLTAAADGGHASRSTTVPSPPAPLSAPEFSASVRKSAKGISSVPAAVIAHSVVATVATESGAPPTRTVSGSVVRGKALTGQVVSASCSASAPSTAVRAVVVSAESVAVAQAASSSARAADASVSTPATVINAESTSLSDEETAKLRLRIVVLEATQGLLASTEDELSSARSALALERERLKAALADLSELRKALDTDGTNTSSPLSLESGVPLPSAHRIADTQMRLAKIEEEARVCALRYESAVYATAQLQETLSRMARENALLKETNTHLEGQLQRILMGSVESAATSAPQHTSASAGLSTREAYQKGALEKQISDLQAIIDKLTRDEEKMTVRCAKAEKVAQSLQRENTELKASVLQYRRQVSDNEMILEHAVSREEEEERLRQLERDANRLRSALRERSDQHRLEKAHWEQRQVHLCRQLRVHELAATQLLRRLLAFQVREVISQQCHHATAPRSPGCDAQTAAPVLIGSNRARETPAPTTFAASSSPVSPLPNRDIALGADGVSLPSTTPERGKAVDTAALMDRKLQLEDLKHTFERRVALVEAQCRAETQQLLALNKELRQALAVSQDEVRQTMRLLEAAQRQTPTPAAMQFGNNLARPSVTTTSRGPSLSGVWQDTSTAGVCHNDGDGRSADVSVDDLNSSDPLVLTRIPAVASSRQITDIERRYNPENMSTWEAVQVENEALLDRLTTMQEEKWRLTTMVEDLQRQCVALKDEHNRQASAMNQLLAAGVLTPVAVTRGGEEGRLRALQCLLQETLHAKMELEERLQAATRQLT